MKLELPTDADPVKVYQGDCLQLLRELPDGCVDAVITDPPYGDKIHAGALTTRPGVDLTTEKLVTFDSIDGEFFLGLCEQLVRVSKRWVLLTCDWRHAAAAENCGSLPVIRTGVWVKPDSAPQFTGDRPGTGWEAVLLLHRKGKKRWNGGGHHAVWTHGIERGNVHPTQKPVQLVRRWVKQFTDPGEIILDPFAGSGTTGVAAVAEGRRCVLIEQEPGYCEIARKRVEKALCREPGNLFAPVAGVE